MAGTETSAITIEWALADGVNQQPTCDGEIKTRDRFSNRKEY